MIPQTNTTQASTREPVLLIAIELAQKNWKLGFSDGSQQRIVTITGGAQEEFLAEAKKAKMKFCLGDDVKMVSCYEAGRDGFWIHRFLLRQGIENVVVDPASIEVDRRKKHAKTDRIDVTKLLAQLARWHGGEKRALRILYVPSEQDEDERRVQRELERLKHARARYVSRIGSFLSLEGVRVKHVSSRLIGKLDKLRTWEGKPLPLHMHREIKRDCARLLAIENDIDEVRREREELLCTMKREKAAKIQKLQSLRAIAKESSFMFVLEFFGSVPHLDLV